MWNELQRFCRIPRSRQWLLGEALIALSIARIAMALLPFRRVAAWMGTLGAETPATATAIEIGVAEEIGWAVRVLAGRVPWDGRCLAQALAATGMLRRRGLEGTVNFGVCRGEITELDAHAWLRFGPHIVTGGPGHQRFNSLTTFARREP
jgi:hypothetical protein